VAKEIAQPANRRGWRGTHGHQQTAHLGQTPCEQGGLGVRAPGRAHRRELPAATLYGLAGLGRFLLATANSFLEPHNTASVA